MLAWDRGRVCRDIWRAAPSCPVSGSVGARIQREDASATLCFSSTKPAMRIQLLAAGVSCIVPSLALAQSTNGISSQTPPANQPYLARAGMQQSAGLGDCTLIDFEGVPNTSPVGIITGPVDVTFGPSWLGLVDSDAGGSGNFANEPTADTVAFFTGSLEPIDFSLPVSFVEVSYVASAVSLPVTLTAWDGPNGTGNVVATATGTTLGASFDGAGCVGDPEGTFCLFDTMGVNGDGILSVTIGGAVADQFAFDNMTFCVDSFGTNFCQSLPNSTGIRSNLVATGSVVAADNDLTLQAVNLPLNASGYLVNSRTPINFPLADGILCLGPDWGRHIAQMGNSGATGSITTVVDLVNLPRPMPNSVMAMAGETWYFQLWHRDGTSSNLTDGVSVTFE